MKRGEKMKKNMKVKARKNWIKEGTIATRKAGRMYFVKGKTVFSTRLKRGRGKK